MPRSSLSTVLAQDHFYSDFLSLLLTKQIHFESVRMIAFAQHSLSVLTSVKLMIECVVHLLSRFLCQSFVQRNNGCVVFGGFGNGLLLKNRILTLRRRPGAASLPISQSSILRQKRTMPKQLSNVPWTILRAPLMFCMVFDIAACHQHDRTFSAFWL